MPHQAIPNTRENFCYSLFNDTTFQDVYIPDLTLKL